MVEEVARVADFAEKLRRYFSTVASAIAFFVFGMVCGGYWLIMSSLNLLFPWAVLGMIVIVILCLYSMSKALPGRMEVPRHEGLRWIFAFVAPFTVLYAIPLPDPRLYTISWYLALGIALLLVHLLIERREFARGSIVAKPFLVSSIIMLVTYPLIVYMLYAGSLISSWMFALGLLLIAYFVAGVYALNRASKLFS
ncbi:MAG: hypothetical protein DRJ51_04430 [Thermoprotei archaeon]|nr:MAG: hypothetical protein DRJ36_02525 [Thermoprotei archaeon]RLE81129.1 MAG: hypothetical protein DRJ51_04430 [Thermoprotei archaeon]